MDLWEKYWGSNSYPLFPEPIHCSNISITSLNDTITIKDNNIYTFLFPHIFLIKIIRKDSEHKHFNSISYVLLQNTKSITLRNLINGYYDFSFAVSYTNDNNVNDYVWSEFCTIESNIPIQLTIPKYITIDNEVYWEYHFVLPADHEHTKGGLPRYFDNYQGKMRNYYLTWFNAVKNLADGNPVLGGASLENCTYDLRYTINAPNEDSIWKYYNDVPFQKK